MIAYKVFYSNREKLYPVAVSFDFEPYDPEFIITRADGCGPFAAFVNLEQAKRFKNYWKISQKIFKVNIKKSKNKSLWIDGWMRTDSHIFPEGTILADEFEILEEVK